MLATRIASSQPARSFHTTNLQHNLSSTSSARWVRHQSQKSAKPGDNAQKHTNPGEMPAFSLKDLGATPAVKAVVYITLGVIGTAETITYGQWAYRKWWKPAVEEVTDE